MSATTSPLVFASPASPGDAVYGHQSRQRRARMQRVMRQAFPGRSAASQKHGASCAAGLERWCYEHCASQVVRMADVNAPLSEKEARHVQEDLAVWSQGEEEARAQAVRLAAQLAMQQASFKGPFLGGQRVGGAGAESGRLVDSDHDVVMQSPERALVHAQTDSTHMDAVFSPPPEEKVMPMCRKLVQVDGVDWHVVLVAGWKVWGAQPPAFFRKWYEKTHMLARCAGAHAEEVIAGLPMCECKTTTNETGEIEMIECKSCIDAYKSFVHTAEAEMHLTQQQVREQLQLQG